MQPVQVAGIGDDALADLVRQINNMHVEGEEPEARVNVRQFKRWLQLEDEPFIVTHVQNRMVTASMNATTRAAAVDRDESDSDRDGVETADQVPEPCTGVKEAAVGLGVVVHSLETATGVVDNMKKCTEVRFVLVTVPAARRLPAGGGGDTS